MSRAQPIPSALEEGHANSVYSEEPERSSAMCALWLVQCARPTGALAEASLFKEHSTLNDADCARRWEAWSSSVSHAHAA